MLMKRGIQALLLVLAVGLSVAVHAQVVTTGNISGTVRDAQGAGIPDAEITLVEQGKGYSRTVRSDDQGFYVASILPAGVYMIATSPPGFKKTVAEAVTLHVSESRTVNLQVEVGAVSETVTVSSEANLVETRSGEVSSLVSQKQVTELPLNGRNYAQLLLLVPGVSPGTGGQQFTATGTGLDAGVDVSVNGNGSNNNLWTVDGVNNMDVGSNRTLLVFPSIDSIQEFRVERNSFSAEFGQAQGAVINLITKGGSNQFHGTGYEFFRNSSMNATNFFLNKAGQPKGELTYNDFGGVFTGPIIKNKLFFFWSEEWRNEDRGVTVSGNVPTAAEKQGNFSGVLTNPLPHDPFTGLPYPGNIIPAARLSPAGLAILKIFPDPNAGGSNWISSPTQPIRTRQDNIRGDWNINSKMNLMARFINEKWTHGQDNQQWGDVPFPTLADDWNQPSKLFSIKLTNTLSSTMVNDFQFSRAGNNIFISTSPQSDALVADIAAKFPTVFPQANPNVPSVLWGGGGYTNIWKEGPWQNHEDLWVWKDDFSKVMGSHDLKFGVLFGHGIKNEQLGGAGGGNTPSFITGNGSKTGHAIADLLDRNLTLTNYQETASTGVALGRWNDREFYGNDTWRFNKKITLTLGLRYSQFPTAYVDNDQISNLVPQFYDGVSYTSALITPATAGSHGLPNNLVLPYNGGFQPRVGIAWDVFGDGKTAVRAGFGRYLSRSNVIEDVLRMAGNPPWTTAVDSGWSGATDTLAGCPTCRTLDAIGPNLKNQVVGVSQTGAFAAVDINFRPPDSYQWNLTVSREVMKNTVLEVSYIGNHGLHIWRRNVNWNDIPPNQACKGGVAAGCDGSTRDARYQIAQRTRLGLDTNNIIAANRRINTLGPITMSQSTGNSSYNAMQVWLNRRFSERLAFQAAYTWAHAISDIPLNSFTNSTTDPFNYGLDRGDADLDRRNSFTGNVVYVLPAVKKWGNAANQILGDWQLNGIYSYFGSAPVDIISGPDTYGTAGNVNSRPNLVAGVPIYLHNSNDATQWLNPAAFALPGVGELGSLGRGSIRGKAQSSLDLSVVKNWNFKERYSVQFRWEMFNAFNSANFASYNNGINFEGNITRPNFGQPTNGAFGYLTNTRPPREMQLGLKFNF